MSVVPSEIPTGGHVFDIRFNLAALQLGSTLSSILFGISTSQAYTYFSRYPDDPPRLKLLVLVVWLLEVGHSVATIAGYFTISIVDYYEPMRWVTYASTGYSVSLLFSGTLATVVQVYFAVRIKKITEKSWITWLCWTLSFFRFVGTVWITILLFIVPLADFGNRWEPLVLTVWVVGAVVDVTIAAALSIDLIKKRRFAILRKRVLDQIIAATIQTGLLTSLNTVAIAICFTTMPNNFVWSAVGSILPKLFSISLFASLNAREALNRQSLLTAPIVNLDFLETDKSTGRNHSRAGSSP